MSDQPNVLILHADQHRYDCLGAYGNKDIRTPHIDAIARDGVVFDNSFCPHPVCTPSRYSFLTGLYVHQHLGTTNRSTVPSGIPTFPRRFRDHGYNTVAVGKMHFTPTYLDMGFSEMRLAEQNGMGRYEDDYHRWLKAEGLFDCIDLMDQEAEFRQLAPHVYWDSFGAMESNLDEHHHSTTWIGDQAMQVLDTWDEGSNLLMVGFIKPHHPFDPPAPWSRMYRPDDLELLPGWTDTLIHGDDGRGYFDYSKLTEETLRHVMAMYYATISHIDHQVGRMLGKLKERGLYDNTIVVYTSDHGEFLGFHHRLLKGYRMLEPLVRVPLIIKFAGSAGPRGHDARLVNNIDFAPTILSAAGLPVPDSMAGLRLTDPHQTSDYVFAEWRGEFMVRTASEKLLLRQDETSSMFFDLATDPYEQNNLYRSPRHQDRVQALTRALLDWRLFRSPAPRHLDEHAPVCRSADRLVAPGALYRYFKERMTSSCTGDDSS